MKLCSVLTVTSVMGSPLVRLPLLAIDNYSDQPVTRDDTGQSSGVFDSRLTDPSPLFPADPPNAVAFSIVRSVVEPGTQRGSSRQNALFDVVEAFQVGFVYQIRFQETDFQRRPNDAIVGFGLSTPELYGSSWTIRGAFVGSGGNLYTQGFLDSGYLPYYRPGTIVDIFVEVEPNTVNLYLAQDNSPRGHAYKFDACDPAKVTLLRPVVSFDERSSETSVVVIQFAKKPLDESLQMPYRNPPPLEEAIPSKEDPVGIRGEWSGYLDGMRISTEVQPDDKEPNVYLVSFHYINFMRAVWNVTNLEAGTVQTQGVISTMIGTDDPEKNSMEAKVTKAFDSVTQVVRNSPSEVHALYGPAQKVLVLKREPKNKTPQTDNPFC